MSADAEFEIDSFLSRIENVLPKVDTKLVVKTMYFERTMQDVYPSAELYIHYKKGTNVERKRDEMRSVYGFMAGLHDGGVYAKGNMNVGLIQKIAKDPDIEEITGDVTIASY